jgi:tripartite-type tricarboxylate transporter receptor subunit TctC
VHRPGAGGEIGFAAIANAPADGYTIGFVNTPPLITVPIERTAQFGGPQRFDLLGNVIDDPCNFSVHAGSEIKNLKERAAGVKMTHVPFKGAADVRRRGDAQHRPV